jgi:chromatin segregation and condensation protein Rec8/ScpA/Scc1 (kleisin family)
MSERMSPSSEHHEQNNSELEATRAEKLNELQEAGAEKDPTRHAETRAERAREVINRQEPEPESPAENQPAAPPQRQPMALLDHHLNYTQTMASLQKRLSPASRRFSKVIHAPAVEKASEALETTSFRAHGHHLDRFDRRFDLLPYCQTLRLLPVRIGTPLLVHRGSFARISSGRCLAGR